MFRRQHLRVSLETSDLFNEQSFYEAFRADVRRASKSVIIESLFLTVRRVWGLQSDLKQLASKGIEVRVYTRTPSHQTKRMEAESEAALRLLRAVNVRVFVCYDMRHRKLAIIDDTILWEGSLNILSQSNSRELMRRTVSQRLCHDIFKITRLDKQSW